MPKQLTPLRKSGVTPTRENLLTQDSEQAQPSQLVTNLPMERSVLGSCLESADELLPAVIEAGLKADDFAVTDHQRIFSMMVEMHEKNFPIDLHSVAEALGYRDGCPLIGDLIVGVVSQRDHVLHHA